MEVREDWREDRGWEEKEGGRKDRDGEDRTKQIKTLKITENQQTGEILKNFSLCLDYVGDINSKPFSLL